MMTTYHFKIDNLKTKVLLDRIELGKEAAFDVASKIKEYLNDKNEIRMVFAAAPSQNEFLEELIKHDIEWDRITAFHMDEYLDLPDNSIQLFSNYLKLNLFEKVKFKNVFYLNSNNNNNNIECSRYAALIKSAPIDIVCMGIGENGHIAFNDPPVAQFQDKEIVKIVELEESCRQQQVNDGCFTTLLEVPKFAITLTVPTLFSANYLSVVVPGKRKAEAVYKTLFYEISTDCPSTIIRSHKDVMLYIDEDSFSLSDRKIKSYKESN